MKKIIQIFITTVIFCVLVFFTFVLISSKIPIFGIKSFVVMTGSMEPRLPTGSILFVKKLNNYNVGDVVSYTKDANVITHRIISTTENGFITKGDANNIADGTQVIKSQIIGKKIFYFPIIGKIIVFVKTIPGFAMLFLLPGLAIIFSELKKIKGEFEKEIEKRLSKKLSKVTNWGFEIL